MATSYSDSGNITNLSNMLKQVYPKEYVNIPTAYNYLGLELPFDTSNKVGQKYVVPVCLSLEAGLTFLSDTAGIQELNSPVQAYTGSAEVVGSQVYLRTALDYQVLLRSLSDKQAFKRASEFQMKNLTVSLQKVREQNLLYGSWLGTTTGTGTATTTTDKVTISAATWSDGIWSNSEKMKVQLYNGGTTLISSGDDSVFIVSVVDYANKAVTLTGTATGITALEAALNVTGGTTIEIHYNGGYGNSMTGLYTILKNTSATLFNISAANYSAWGGNYIDVGTGSLTADKLNTACATLAGRGMMGDLLVLMSPRAWKNVAAGMNALQRYDYSYSKDKAEYGIAEIEVIGTTGKQKLVAHPLVKDGHVIAVPKDGTKRIGWTDITFGDPVSGQYVTQVPNYNALSIMGMYGQAVFCETPSHGGVFYGFTIS
jgi:hypothetical protein